jgi:dTDP-4-amino-4,6-dideoxygalactose transaminase
LAIATLPEWIVIIIYDAAHAFGVENNGVGIGNYGDISMFSFHATKLFHTAEGGALTFHDPRLKKNIDLAKNFGIKSEDEVVTTGINGKMNELQAALGLAVLDMIDEEREKRQRLSKVYQECLRNVGGITYLPELPGVKNAYQYFIVRIDAEEFGSSRDDVYQRFKKYNIFTRRYFYPLCSEYDCYKDLPSANPDNLPIANKVAGEVLSLPYYGALSEDQAVKIAAILKSFPKDRRF